jgi:hypothetical protein
MPELVIDRREIIEARFIHPTLLEELRRPRNKIGPYIYELTAKCDARLPAATARRI